MDRNSYNTRDPVLVLTSKGRNQDPTPPEPEYVQDVTAKAGISVTGSKVNKQVGVRLSEDEGNSLSFGVDDGLYASTVKDEIKDGIGTKVVNVTTKAKLWDKIKRKFGYGDVQKIAIDLQPPTVDIIGGVKLSTKTENAAEIDDAGNLFVSKQSASKTLVDGENTKVKEIPDTNKIAIDVLTGDGTTKKGVYGIDTEKQDNQVSGENGLLYVSPTNLIIQQQLYAHEIEINALYSGANVLKSGVPVLADIQAAIQVTGILGVSFNFAISGVLTGLVIRMEDVPTLYDFAVNMTEYMQRETSTKPSFPHFEMAYNGINFIISNGLADNILLSPNQTGNDVLKISQLGGAEILNINDSKDDKNYYVRWELSELAGFDELDTKSSIIWDDYAVASPVVGLKVPKDGIGEAMGFDTEFFNKNPDGTGQREYKVKLKFSVITDAGHSGSSIVTIGKPDSWDQNEGAFHMWTAGIVPEIDYSNQNTDRNDIYTFKVNNFRVTPITITLNKTVFIENRLRKFYFGISMKGWFPNPDTVNYKLYDYVELFLEEVIPSGNIKSKNKIRNTGHTLSKRTISKCTDKD